MKKYQILSLLILIVLVGIGCDQEMLLTDFTDYDFDYEPEIRIEALLNMEYPLETVVRIDYSMSVNDTTIFNGRDDDGDWIGYYDVNGNGQWDLDEPLNDDLGGDGMPSTEFEMLNPDDGEGDGLPTNGEPHIDELDEIICQLHDSTFTVELYNVSTGAKVADFTWLAQADSFEVMENSFSEITEIVWYGGYKLTNLLEPLDYSIAYEFRISRGSTVITAAFQPEEPVEFLTVFFPMNNDTLLVTAADSLAPIWTTGTNPLVYWITIEKIYRPDSIDVVDDYATMPIDLENGIYIGADFTDWRTSGLYRYTVYVPSVEYGQYVYSSLPITDSSVSNWRDQDGEVVLGIAGSLAPKSIYARIDKGDQ